ncbi:Trm112 family protein [Pseudoalteromonas distincta]|uniref:Trm112 family protein n=1 Tax=Pseudoalteromonas distincta TaxID=77608 RepID=UPI00242AD6F8|nr:Trm112 family protein [Pseudoalteromonas distincta]|tara:strand:+ start:73 stop:270 length:198 start_codon:yes stop_codon:yes gene_type:complete
MAFDTKLLEIIACPVCKGKLCFDRENNELISTAAKLAYPVQDDIPVLLENEARELSLEEVEKWNS